MEEIPKAQTIRLIIDSKLENVFLIGLCIRGVCASLPLNDVAAFQVEVSVVEAVNNAVKHAYQNQAGHEVEVLITLPGDRITCQVCDSGSSMDADKIPASRLDFDPNHLERLPEGGMGLHIIRSAMDSVDYRRSGHKNIFSMSKLFREKR